MKDEYYQTKYLGFACFIVLKKVERQTYDDN